MKEYILKIVQNGREVWTIENENIEPKPTQSQNEVIITTAALLWQATILRRDLITTFKMDERLATLNIKKVYDSLQKTGITQSEDLI